MELCLTWAQFSRISYIFFYLSVHKCICLHFSKHNQLLFWYIADDTCMQGHWSDISNFSTDYNTCIFGLPIFWKFNSSVYQIISTSVLEAYFYRINWFHVFSQNKNPCRDKFLQLAQECGRCLLGETGNKKILSLPIYYNKLRLIIDLNWERLRCVWDLVSCKTFLYVVIFGMASVLRTGYRDAQI
jgi:hypothetical protein